MNFEIRDVAPTPEHGPKAPSLEEVKSTVLRFKKGTDIPGSEKGTDSETPEHYEIATIDEMGIGALYMYTLDTHTGDAEVTVAYSTGNPTEGNWIPGGSPLSKYNGTTHMWSDIDLGAIAPELLPHRTEALPDEVAKHPELSKPVDDASPEEKAKYLDNIIVRANIKSTRALFEIAKHEETPHEELLEMIYSALIVLNKAQANGRELESWNADGELTRDEFLEFTRQFDALQQVANTTITKTTIKENANKRFEDEPVEQGLEKLESLFHTAEKILGTTDVAQLEQRERDMLPVALERRALAAHFANRTLNGILRLNQSYEPYASIKNWNPEGKLKGESGENKFKEIVRRREILMKALGSVNMKLGGISHN